jgi:hypothetical protein
VPRSYISSVLYSSAALLLTATMRDCLFTVPHEQLVCKTSPGIGTNFRVEVRAVPRPHCMSSCRCVP